MLSSLVVPNPDFFAKVSVCYRNWVMGSPPGGEGCLVSMAGTRYGSRHCSQDGLERKEVELSPIQRVNAGLAAHAARWAGDKDWAGLQHGARAGGTPPACPASAVVEAGGKLG